MRHGADPFLFEDDARQNVVPFLVPGYASDYYLTYLPIGYKALLRSVAAIGDPIAFSRALPYPLLLVLMVLIGLVAGRLGGITAGAASVALCLSTAVFLNAMIGGNPRTFGFPWIAAGAAALTWGRAWWLALVVVGATAFYQPAAVALGLALTLYLLVLPARDRGDAESWSFRRRLTLLVATGTCAVLILAPGLMARGYGPMLTAHDLPAYPELGEGGRYGEHDRLVAGFPSVWSELLRQQRETLVSGPPWSARLRAVVQRVGDRGMIAVAGAMLVGFALIAAREPAARRLTILGVAALTAYASARLVAPYLYVPERYLAYAFPVLIVIALPVSAGAAPLLARALSGHRWSRPLATVVIVGACLLVFGGPGDDRAGLTIAARNNTPVFEFVRTLPASSVLAGWPGFEEPIDSVPFVTRRQAFLTYETHQVFHRGYADTMRRRMRAVIEGIFATDSEPLRRLRDEWGVTHLIVDRRYFDTAPPRYFKPFDDWTQEAMARGHVLGFEVPRQMETATVFSHGHLAVLSLGPAPASKPVSRP
jgi:hypothetical protein